ncbi:MAG TPA: FAD binding domain-containing protein [Stellaceae bacterium]|nr:FAD binding domain-containing protein [Stellaceae bacterium]
MPADPARPPIDARAPASHSVRGRRAGRSTPRWEDFLKAPRFAYLRVSSLAQVFDAFAEHGEEARILAGGQSLVPALNMRLAEPRLLIDINPIAALAGIERRESVLRIGALARHSEVGASPLVAELAPLIHQAVPHIAHPAIRNRGSFGGSLAQADPAAELPACVVALDAVLHLASRRGERRVAARDFFRGPYETALAPDEVIAAVDIPVAPKGARSVFLELARRRGDYALAGLAAEAREDGLRLVFFGVGGRPVEAGAAASALAARDIAAAQAALARDLDPPGDLQADGATKLHLARVLLGRAARALAAA